MAAAWAGWVYGQAYLDHFDVKEEVWLAFSTTVTGEHEARARLMQALNAKIGWHYELDEGTGEETIKPGLGVPDEAVEIVLNPETKVVRVRVEYDRVLPLKPSDRRTTVHFVAEKTGKLQ